MPLLVLLVFISNSFALEREVVLEWEEVPGARHYEVEVTDEADQIVKRLRFKKNRFDLPLKVGAYKIRARSVDVRGARGDWSAPESLVVPPAQTQFVEAPQKPIVASTENLKAEVELKWLA